MNKVSRAVSMLLLVSLPCIAVSEEDQRELVPLPEMTQQHMLSNMRDHLMAFNEILASMANGELDHAADIAEHRLGMSSLESHGAIYAARDAAGGYRYAPGSQPFCAKGAGG
jgi:hypothetical protein